MQEWYDSDAPGIVADVLIHDLHMNPENKTALINIVGDTTLGLIPVADLTNQILNYIAMPLPLARVLAEHLVMLLTQAKVLGAPVSTPAPTPAPIPQPPPVHYQQPTPTSIPIPVSPPPQPVAPPTAPAQTTWQHVQGEHGETVRVTQQANVLPPQATPPPQTPPQTPPPIPQYQKPLTAAAPQYRNADLYKKPPQ